MTRATLAGGALLATVPVLIALAVGYRVFERERRSAESATPAVRLATTETRPAPQFHQGFLYGRIGTTDGETYEGRLRFGGDEEAFWGDHFQGSKDGNPWPAHVPPEHLRERHPIRILGVEIGGLKTRRKLDRPFLARFGDIARIEADGRELRVTLKSGTVVELDRFDADDLADGLRVWDATRGVVDLDEWSIRTIELLPTPSLDVAPYRLHGTVRTLQGDFTGFIQWNRRQCVGTDELAGHTPDGAVRVRFDGIRSIERDAGDGAVVTLLDGREVVFSELGQAHRGTYVDDRRFGRVRIAWDVLERVDFGSDSGSGPAYGEFPPGTPLTGSVTTRAGARLTGRLVYDLDESETTDTLDAPFQGVHYTLPFGLVASIVPRGREQRDGQPARLRLHNGEGLWLERTGDLGEGNAGILIFVEGRPRPEYVPWADVEQIDFDPPFE